MTAVQCAAVLALCDATHQLVVSLCHMGVLGWGRSWRKRDPVVLTTLLYAVVLVVLAVCNGKTPAVPSEAAVVAVGTGIEDSPRSVNSGYVIMSSLVAVVRELRLLCTTGTPSSIPGRLLVSLNRSLLVSVRAYFVMPLVILASSAVLFIVLPLQEEEGDGAADEGNPRASLVGALLAGNGFELSEVLPDMPYYICGGLLALLFGFVPYLCARWRARRLAQ